MKKEFTGLLALGALAIAAYFVFFRKKEEEAINALASLILTANPELSRELAVARAAELLGGEALQSAQAAEDTAGVDEAAQAALEAERVRQEADDLYLQDLADEEARLAAVEAARQAAIAREALIASWNSALTTAEDSAKSAMFSLKTAADQYKIAEDKINSKQAYITGLSTYGGAVCFLWGDDNYKAKTKTLKIGDYPRIPEPVGNDQASSLQVIKNFAITAFVNIDYDGFSQTWDAADGQKNVPSLRETTFGNDMMSSIKVYPSTWVLENAKNQMIEDLDKIRVEVIACKSHANDCIERVLTMTADIRILGILGARLDSLESMAYGMRNILAGIVV